MLLLLLRLVVAIHNVQYVCVLLLVLLLETCRHFPFGVGIDSYKWELSGGQKRIIGLVRAIIRDSKILLLDEPTNDLDPDRQEVGR